MKSKKNPKANNWKERLNDKVEKVAGKMVASKLKGKSLDEKAGVLIRLVNAYPQQLGAARLKFINDTKAEIGQLIKDGKDNEYIFKPCYDSENYMKLLKIFDIDIRFFETIADEIRGSKNE